MTGKQVQVRSFEGKGFFGVVSRGDKISFWDIVGGHDPEELPHGFDSYIVRVPSLALYAGDWLVLARTIKKDIDTAIGSYSTPLSLPVLGFEIAMDEFLKPTPLEAVERFSCQLLAAASLLCHRNWIVADRRSSHPAFHFLTSARPKAGRTKLPVWLSPHPRSGSIS